MFTPFNKLHTYTQNTKCCTERVCETCKLRLQQRQDALIGRKTQKEWRRVSHTINETNKKQQQN